MIEESDVRYKRIMAEYDPITGDGLQFLENPITHENLYNRELITIPDHIIPEQWLTEECRKNSLVKLVIEYGSITNYLSEAFGIGEDHKLFVKMKGNIQIELMKARRNTDPTFWFYVDWAIKPKDGEEDNTEADDDDIDDDEELEEFDENGDVIVREHKKENSYALIPFKLNYGQLILLSYYEALRLAHQPILIVVCKARQWGASTLTQCYFAWIQLNLKRGWYSAIVAQNSSTANKIRMMYTKGIIQYDPRLLDIKDKEAKLRFAPYADSKTSYQIVYGPPSMRKVARDIVISIGTYEKPDALPGDDMQLLHYSEVALWATTIGKTPEMVIKSVSGGFKMKHLAMEVMESTPRGSGNFFQIEYDAAKRGESNRHAVFIPWWLLLGDTEPVEDKAAFAKWVYDNKDNEDCPKTIPEVPGKKCLNSGKYIWKLWSYGATLEGIKWYVKKRLSFHRQQDMASEAPSDDIEAFTNTESLAFDLYEIRKMREMSQEQPKMVGDIYSDYGAKAECIKDFHFTENIDGRMLVYRRPEKRNIRNRYLVVVDIGGEWKGADWSVIRVIDRIGLLEEGGMEETALVWSGHVPHSHLAWKAVQVAMWYDNALLVFESNTLEQKDNVHNVDEGDQSNYILNEIGKAYRNLYTRSARMPNDLHGKKITKFGYHTNRETKPIIVNMLTDMIHNCNYIEHDDMTFGEMESYERTEKGVYQATPGKKDDRLMTLGIGLDVSRNHMPRPKEITATAKGQKGSGFTASGTLAGF